MSTTEAAADRRPSVSIVVGGGWPGPLLAAVLLCFSSPIASGVERGEARAVPAGPFTQGECVQCHEERDPGLVAQWRAGPHGIMADCRSCHGPSHGNLPLSRSDGTCSGCHGGPVADSYAKSKHGVLVRMERPQRGEPLRRAAYRAPGCAYCHLHEGDHGDTMAAARGPAARDWVCSGCHAPRYVRQQLEAGERLWEIARLKLAEAQSIAERHPRGAAALGELLVSSQRHGRNVRLGSGHQSPDYQWWHGQPALDGDLVRLRAAVAGAERAAVSASAD